jgi:hypothetical protein
MDGRIFVGKQAGAYRAGGAQACRAARRMQRHGRGRPSAQAAPRFKDLPMVVPVDDMTIAGAEIVAAQELPLGH